MKTTKTISKQMAKLKRKYRDIDELLKNFPLKGDPTLLPRIEPHIWETKDSKIIRHRKTCRQDTCPPLP
jgi:hypothetical protein